MKDPRLVKRLVLVTERLMKQPSKSNPQALGTQASREAFYRFIRNERVGLDEILSGPFKESSNRMRERAGQGRLLALHDTTVCSFSTPRKGLGCVTGKGSPHGLYAHVTMGAVLYAGSERAEPLGILGLQSWTRGQGKAPRKGEASKWLEGVKQVQAHNPGPVTHVMDRDADSYLLFESIIEQADDFVIRLHIDRHTPKGRLYELGLKAPIVAEREVQISSRVPQGGEKRNKQFPSRSSRFAKLEIRACSVQVPVPRWRKKVAHQESLWVNLVEVQEPNPPPNQPAVCWRLMTTLPIQSEAQVLHVVDIYRNRWLIEELFKALKTGCGYEKQQLQSYDTLVRSLGCYLPVACEMLRLRYASSQTNRLACEVLDKWMMRALRAIAPTLPQQPTAKQALYAIASYGGHFKNNGPPGWLTLSRGYRDLLLLAEGIQLASTCDQS